MCDNLEAEKARLSELYFVQGLSGRDTARSMRIPIGSIWGKLRRIGKLRCQRQSARLFAISHPENIKKANAVFTRNNRGRHQSVESW